MSDNHTAVSDASELNADASKFFEVVSGIYRRFDSETVWRALRYAVQKKLMEQNPAIMLMFVRIAEVYPDARRFLQSRSSDATVPQQQAIELILEPPQEIRSAAYLPDSIQSPGEMDLCWAEFLVTGKTDVIQKIVSLLDRDDRTRAFIQSQLSDETPAVELSDVEKNELQQYGIGIGKLSEERGWEVLTPGDADLFLWLGVKDQNPVCTRILQAMDEPLRLHLATKGAALWSLQANAGQHGSIRLLCDEAAEVSGGEGRSLLKQA